MDIINNGLVGWIGGVLTTIVGVVVMIWRERRAASKEKFDLTQKADSQRLESEKGALERMGALLTLMEGKIVGLNKQLAEERQESHELIRKMQERMDRDEAMAEEKYNKLHVEHVRCQLETAALRSELRLLNLSIKHSNMGLPGFAITEQWGEVYVIADQNGRMLSVNPAIGSLLHWLPEELVGHNVRKIIPPRYRSAHEAAIKSIVEGGRMPTSGRILSLHGLTREGYEVPMYAQVTAWRKDDEWVFCASVWGREEGEGAASVSSYDIPVAPPLSPELAPAPAPAS